jgi:hypothetical protein
VHLAEHLLRDPGRRRGVAVVPPVIGLGTRGGGGVNNLGDGERGGFQSIADAGFACLRRRRRWGERLEGFGRSNIWSVRSMYSKMVGYLGEDVECFAEAVGVRSCRGGGGGGIAGGHEAAASVCARARVGRIPR